MGILILTRATLATESQAWACPETETSKLILWVRSDDTVVIHLDALHLGCRIFQLASCANLARYS